MRRLKRVRVANPVALAVVALAWACYFAGVWALVQR